MCVQFLFQEYCLAEAIFSTEEGRVLFVNFEVDIERVLKATYWMEISCYVAESSSEIFSF